MFLFSIKRWMIPISLLLTITSCGYHSLEDFQEEGEGITRSLIQDLKKIHNREQLILASERLKHHFDRLVLLMISAEEFSLSHPKLENKEGERISHDLSDELYAELNRIYRMEGGRQIIEKCQEKALYQLDAFERRHRKKGNIRSIYDPSI